MILRFKADNPGVATIDHGWLELPQLGVVVSEVLGCKADCLLRRRDRWRGAFRTMCDAGNQQQDRNESHAAKMASNAAGSKGVDSAAGIKLRHYRELAQLVFVAEMAYAAELIR